MDAAAIQACLDETKALLEGCQQSHALRTVLSNLDKIAALVAGDYKAVWEIEAEQRRKDNDFKERVMKNLCIIHKTKLAAAEAAAHASPCVTDNAPLLVALAAMKACRDVPLPALNPRPPPYEPTPETDPDLYN